MREFWTWFALAVVAAAPIALGVLGPAYAEPAGTLPACISSAKLTGLLTDTGATAWPTEGLRAVRFLAIINKIDPPTDYRADAVLAAFPPDGDRMMMFLVNGDCVSREKITLPAKTAVMAMREVFGGMSRREFGVTLVHDQWANGEPVPDFVRRACCGPEDVHHLRPDQVHLQKDGYHVEGLKDPIPSSKMEPSPDGEWWVFYRRFSDGTTSTPYCFFGPFSGT